MGWLALVFLQFCQLSVFVKALNEGTNCHVKTASGECCVFPFTYGSKPYQSCTVDGNGNTLWCATTGNYDTDGKWGNCYMAEHPYRWIPTHGRATTQSSTVTGHEAYYATDGNYNRYHTPLTYSQTVVSDNPYLQVDMGEKKPVDYVAVNFPMLTDPAKTYASIRITLSDSSTFETDSHLCFGTHDVIRGRLFDCNSWGRYLSIQSRKTGVELSVIEIAAHRRPVESVALNKPVTTSSVYGPGLVGSTSVNMNFESKFITNQEVGPWIRVDLEDLHYVHEVMIWTRHDCCSDSKQDLHVRAGRSLANNGNSNHFCGNHVFYTYEIYSFYCKVLARYVNVQRLLGSASLIFSLAEVVVNPETTDNVAVHSSNSGNTAVLDGNVIRRLTDGIYETCHIMIESVQDKKIFITMGGTYEVYKVFIVSNPTKLDAMVDFQIKVGMAGSSKPLCLQGSQNMAGIYTKAFYCQPRRTGNEIFIRQLSSEKTMSMCEVAVFTEAKPEIDRSKDLYIWAEENTAQILLTCEANGYPTPVLSWVRKNETLPSVTSTLELTSLEANDSGEYECWANNTHGLDVKVVDLVVTSNLRVCVNFKEIQFKVGKSESEEFFFKGNQWYSFYDPDNYHSLQFLESTPREISLCQLWLNGIHPKMEDGVVSRELCLGSDCSVKYDVYVRRCSGSFVYNFRDFRKISSSKAFCFKNAKNLHIGMNPAIASPEYGYALSGSVFRTESDVKESYHCLLMCQIASTCKSFNFSRKEKICELNSATKKDIPKNYTARSGYDYYQFGKGMVVTRKGEL